MVLALYFVSSLRPFGQLRTRFQAIHLVYKIVSLQLLREPLHIMVTPWPLPGYMQTCYSYLSTSFQQVRAHSTGYEPRPYMRCLAAWPRVSEQVTPHTRFPMSCVVPNGKPCLNSPLQLGRTQLPSKRYLGAFRIQDQSLQSPGRRTPTSVPTLPLRTRSHELG